MIVSDKMLQSLVARIMSGTDALVRGDAAGSRHLLAQASVALAEGAEVIAATASGGELSLSSLIAQVAGRSDFDGQDDSVLELGFKRLNSSIARTVLVLQTPRGISRSALRYVQHVSRSAPNLVLVVLASPVLDAMLEEAAFAALRTRLDAAPAFETVDAEAELPQNPIPVTPLPRPRRRMMWAISAISVVAAASGAVAWVGYGSSLVDPVGSNRLHLSMPIEPAVIPPPPLAKAQPSTTAMAADLALDAPSPPVDAHAAPPPRPDRVVPPHAISTLTEPPTSPVISSPAKRSHPPIPRHAEPPPRYARLRQNLGPPIPQYDEPSRYAWDTPPPWIVRREMRRSDSAYVGTYAVDPSGVRIFRYDP